MRMKIGSFSYCSCMFKKKKKVIVLAARGSAPRVLPINLALVRAPCHATNHVKTGHSSPSQQLVWIFVLVKFIFWLIRTVIPLNSRTSFLKTIIGHASEVSMNYMDYQYFVSHNVPGPWMLLRFAWTPHTFLKKKYKSSVELQDYNVVVITRSKFSPRGERCES